MRIRIAARFRRLLPHFQRYTRFSNKHSFERYSWAQSTRYQLKYPMVLAAGIASLFRVRNDQGEWVFNPLPVIVAVAAYVVYDEIYSRQYTQKEEEILQQFIAKGEKAEILVLGKARVGKSYLINSLVGQEITDENENETGTFKATLCDYTMKIGNKNVKDVVKIWDTVGFFSKQTQQKCIEELYVAKESNAIIISINGLLNGVPDDLERLVPILNRLYTNDSWIDRTVIAVTRGNEVLKLGYNLKKRQKVWHSGGESIPASLIRAGITPEKANSIPIVWAYSKSDKGWQKLLLWTTMSRATSGKGAMYMINPDLFNNTESDKLISEKITKQVVNITQKKQGKLTKWYKTVATTVNRVFEVDDPQQINVEYY